MQLWNKPKILVVASSWRRSRVTFIDKIFEPIYNKILLTTHFWVVWDNSSSAMQRMPSLLESRHRLLHLRHLLKESEASRGIFQRTLDLLSIQNYVIKMGRLHGHRFLKTKEQRDVNLKSKLIELNEEVCIQMDKDAQKDFTYHLMQAEYFSIQQELVDLSQLVWKNRTGERSFWLWRSVDQITSSSLRIWRRTTRANSILAIPAMAPIIVQHISVAVERFVVGLMTINK